MFYDTPAKKPLQAIRSQRLWIETPLPANFASQNNPQGLRARALPSASLQGLPRPKKDSVGTRGSAAWVSIPMRIFNKKAILKRMAFLLNNSPFRTAVRNFSMILYWKELGESGNTKQNRESQKYMSIRLHKRWTINS